jgi:thioredoxin 1
MPFPRLSAILILASAALAAQVPALDPAGLVKTLKSGTWSVVEFGGPTCVPCRKMQAVLSDIQKQFGARVQVRNFYVTEFAKEARPYRIVAMPTQVVFDAGGREVTRHIGYWDKAEFLTALAKAGLK